MVKLLARKKYVELTQPFRVAFGTIAGLDVVEVELSHEGVVGRGECCPMAIYGQDADTTLAEIAAITPQIESGELDRTSLQKVLPAQSARNAIDCAFWDVEAKLSGRSVWDIAGLEAPSIIPSDVTIGIMTPEETATFAAGLCGASSIKLKLGGEHDLECLAAVRSVLPDTPLFVDVNAGWTLDRLNALAPQLADAKVFMIEQPLAPRDDPQLDEYGRAVPICADESCHDRSDLDRLEGRYQYVNIKLDKTGGLTEALALAEAARQRGFGIMVGCMLGTGLAMAPAYVLASICDVVDLDAPLIVKDPAHRGVKHDGRQLHQFGADLWG
ncbi:dipeptide epimerase [Novosphingobium sp. JCM 18896]|uniref:dipeptide epimerase n=1 Tax=Novosphingobium sp. JCM 18896 TaxID=2989731 RepID=UPI002222867F|nr:dipeptide epimerase [Novosphingobium sp. JCM 18896]MCW1432089.1 dipeptide epimerase [Novosphingobium sp. JCM 18896]